MVNRKQNMLAAMVGAVLSANAGAQVLEEIVVTAQKRAQDVSDVPLSIDALTSQSIENSGVTQIRDMAALSPKLTTAANFQGYQTVLSSRGITASTNLDPVVSTYVDDMPFLILNQGVSPPGGMFDLNRVEIVNGPQGTLFGQGAMGGTVRLYTNDPNYDGFGGTVRVSGAHTEDGDPSYTGGLALNIPIIDGKLAARVSYSREELGGFLSYPNVQPKALNDENEWEFEGWRAKVLWEPSDAISVKLNYWHNEVGAPYGSRLQYPEDDGTREMTFLYQGGAQGEAEHDLYSVNFSWDLGWATLENLLSVMDYDQYSLNFEGSVRGELGTDAESTANELRLVSNLDGPLQYVVGYYYFDGDNDQFLSINLIPPNFPLDIFFGADATEAKSEVNAFFGEVSYEFMDGFVEVLGGLRYFEDDREVKGLADVPPLQEDEFIPSDRGDTFDSWNPRVNVAIRPSEEWMVYVNAAKGFRSGTFNLALSTTAADRVGYPEDVTVIDDDNVVSFELGAKYRSSTGALAADLTLFQSTWSDAQQLVTFDPSVFVSTIVNAGDLDIWGVEYNVTCAPVESLVLNLQGSYIDTEWDSVNGGLENFTGLEEGGPANGIPEHQVLASAAWTTDVNLFGDGLQFQAYVDYRYRDEQSDATGSGIEADSYTAGNLRFTLSEVDSWDLALFVNNFTDHDEVVETSFSFIGNVLRPRETGVSFTKYF